MYNPIWFRSAIITFLFAEGLWAVMWSISMFFFQYTEDTTEHIRVAHLFMAFHAAMPLALLNIYETFRKSSKRTATGIGSINSTLLFWMVFVVMTDLNSTLEVFTHVTTGPDGLIKLLRVNALVGVILSGLGALWYASVLFSSTFDDVR